MHRQMSKIKTNALHKFFQLERVKNLEPSSLEAVQGHLLKEGRHQSSLGLGIELHCQYFGPGPGVSLDVYYCYSSSYLALLKIFAE